MARSRARIQVCLYMPHVLTVPALCMNFFHLEGFPDSTLLVTTSGLYKDKGHNK